MIIRSFLPASLFALSVCFSVNSFAFTTESLLDEVKTNHDELLDALSDGEWSLDFRLRYEDVTNDIGAADRGAQVTTLRTRGRYETGNYHLFSAAFGFQDNRALPDDENYFSGANEEFDDALVSDPEATAINEAWIGYDIINTLFKYGRQPIHWDNGRFVGDEGWRQLGQSYTGLTVRNEFLNYTRFRFAQLHRMETMLDEEVDSGHQSLDATLFNLNYRGILNSLLSFYYYDIDNEQGNDDWDSATYGVRFAGEIENTPTIRYAFEYARQSDQHDNPIDYSAKYGLLDLGVNFYGVQFDLGYEVLGADGAGFLVTPLGSKHEFQGFSDVFAENGLGNISGGVVDKYYGLGYVCRHGLSVFAKMHEFESDNDSTGPGELGDEFTLEAKYTWRDYLFMLKYSDYQRENFGSDTQKIWVNVELSL